MKSFLQLLMMIAFVLAKVTLFAQTNEGTDFWFGFMEHYDRGQEKKVVMVTSEVRTSGTISIPLQNWERTFTVNANDVTIIEIPNSASTLGSELSQNTGIHLTSVQPVAVYIHQYNALRSEATIVLPTTTIDQEYYAVTYSSYANQDGNFPSEFLIVATEDNTEIDITPSDNTKGNRAPGETFSVTLNAGQTYQVQARSSEDDLTGSFISGNKKFNVFAGNVWAQVPSGCNFRDNLVEQMYPVSTWGKQFVTAPNNRTAYDVFRIVAAFDNTTIEVQGNDPKNFTLNAGQYAEFSAVAATYILASAPIAVAQFNVGAQCNGYNLGDPSMVLLNSVEQFREKVTLYNSPFEAISEHYINLIMRTSDVENVMIDGQNLNAFGAMIFPLSANNKFSYAQLSVSAGAHTIESEGCGVIATAYGYGLAESYAYGGGAKFEPINIEDRFIPDGGCLNDTVVFNVPLREPRHTLQWDLGDGTMQTGSNFTHIYNELGTYTVTLYIRDNCLETNDTLVKDILISLRQAVDVPGDVEVCEDANLNLSATDIANATYEWTGPNGYFANEQFPTRTNVQLNDTGTYSVIGIVSGCATFPATLMVEVLPKPQPNLGRDTLICPQLLDFEMILDPGTFAQYRWQDGSTNATFDVQSAGAYSVTVTDEMGCTASDSILLTQVCPTRFYVPNAFSPNNDGINDTFGVLGADIQAITFKIFDRWGNLLFESDEVSKQWDGRFRGEPMGVGVYLWVAEITGKRADDSTFTTIESGTVTLIR